MYRKFAMTFETHCIKNNSFNEKYNSIDNLKSAQMEVISFGWWNKVNHTLNRVNTDNFQTEYRKNFTEIKEECDDSD